jgi:hypothetical protein
MAMGMNKMEKIFDANELNAEELLSLADDAAAVGNADRLRSIAEYTRGLQSPTRRRSAVSEALQARARAIDARLEGRIQTATEEENRFENIVLSLSRYEKGP